MCPILPPRSLPPRLERLEDFLLSLGLWPLGFFFSYLLVTGLLRFAHVAAPLASAAAALLTAGAWVVFSLRPSPRLLLASLVSFGLLCCAAIWLASSSMDISYDGQAIHFPNAVAMADGVNPLFQRPIFPFGDIYPNGLWTLQGLAIHVTSGFEEGKAPAWLLAFASAPLMAVALRILRGAWTPAVAVAAVLAQANPVLLTQLSSFELDGPVYSLAVCAIAGAVLLSSRHRRAGLVVAGCAFVLLANTKITGLYWAGAIAAATVLQAWLQGRSLHVPLIAAAAAATLVVGWTPYVTVPWETGKVFGADLSVVEGPQNLVEAGPATRMAYLLFGRSSNPVAPDVASLEWPGASLFAAPVHLLDISIGGFGPGFGLLFLGALLIGASLAWRMRQIPSRDAAWLGPYWTAVVFVAALLFPVSWWVRLVAPFWLVVVLPLVGRPHAAARGLVRSTAVAGWLLLAVGCLASGSSVVATLRTTAAVEQAMDRVLREVAAQGDAVRIVPANVAQDQTALLWQQRLIRFSIYPRIGSVDGCARPLFTSASVRLCVDASRP